MQPFSCSKILVRATNWVGDAVMSLPAIRAVRGRFPEAHLAVLARPWVADLYARETAIDRVIPYDGRVRAAAARLREEGFDCAILLQNAFEAAMLAWLARIPVRVGYRRDGRGPLLTHGARVPAPGDIPRHERFYYLELLRRTGVIDAFPPSPSIQLEGREAARAAGLERLRAAGVAAPAIGVSPGAAYGNAKRWLPERFAEAARRLGAEMNAPVAVFGTAAERELCDAVAREAGGVSFAGRTTLAEFIEMAAACRLFLTNDSGSMHVATALGVPTVAVFGATDDTTTGPAGPHARVVRELVECSPCLKRECPIDHRCMKRVTVERVAGEGREVSREAAWRETA